MALIVEDGTAKTDSESYASVADADAYLAARGFALWATLTTEEKEQALRRATDYMLQAYAERWGGVRATYQQALDWPRLDVPMRDAGGWYASDAVPAVVRNACIALAYKAAAGDLAADLTPPVIEETIGPISVKYAPGARQTVVYRAIDNMLTPVLSVGSMNFRVARA